MSEEKSASSEGFCGARQSDRPAALHCDLTKGHGGRRHAERWVGTWLRDGSEVRMCVNSGDYEAVRPRYAPAKC